MPSASGAPLLFVPFTRLGSLPAGPLRVLDLRLRRQVTAPARPPCAPVLSAYAGTASGLGGPGMLSERRFGGFEMTHVLRDLFTEQPGVQLRTVALCFPAPVTPAVTFIT